MLLYTIPKPPGSGYLTRVVSDRKDESVLGFLYNTSIVLMAILIGIGIAVLGGLSMIFSRSGRFDSVWATMRLIGLMFSGLGLAFGAILTSVAQRSTNNETPLLVIVLVGACAAYYLWLVLNMMFRSGRSWPAILLCASLLFLAGGLLCETLVFLHENWALGVTFGWFAFLAAALAMVVTMVVKCTKKRHVRQIEAQHPRLNA